MGSSKYEPRSDHIRQIQSDGRNRIYELMCGVQLLRVDHGSDHGVPSLQTKTIIVQFIEAVRYFSREFIEHPAVREPYRVRRVWQFSPVILDGLRLMDDGVQRLAILAI